jgi:hypothetical protein
MPIPKGRLIVGAVVAEVKHKWPILLTPLLLYAAFRLIVRINGWG